MISTFDMNHDMILSLKNVKSRNGYLKFIMLKSSIASTDNLEDKFYLFQL